MQALDDHHLVRLDAHRRLERAVGMVVDRFGDRLSALERPELLLHEREVVGARIERRHADQGSLAAIEGVIVVEADGGDAIGAEQVVEGRRQRRLAAAAVTANADEHRGTGNTFGLREARVHVCTIDGTCVAV